MTSHATARARTISFSEWEEGLERPQVTGLEGGGGGVSEMDGGMNGMHGLRRVHALQNMHNVQSTHNLRAMQMHGLNGNGMYALAATSNCPPQPMQMSFSYAEHALAQQQLQQWQRQQQQQHMGMGMGMPAMYPPAFPWSPRPPF